MIEWKELKLAAIHLGKVSAPIAELAAAQSDLTLSNGSKTTSEQALTAAWLARVNLQLRCAMYMADDLVKLAESMDAKLKR